METAQKTSVQQARKLEKETLFRTVPVNDPGFVPLLDSLHVQYFAEPVSRSSLFNMLLTWIVPFGLLLVIWQFIFSRMGRLGAGVMAFGQNRAQLVAEGDTKTTFADVAGADEAKEELAEIVDFLKTPEKYTVIGGKIPKGVLLVGPPGTGIAPDMATSASMAEEFPAAAAFPSPSAARYHNACWLWSEATAARASIAF